MRKISMILGLHVALGLSPCAWGNEISADYLLGPWCYLHVDFGDSKSEENVNWDFRENGELFTQQSQYSDKLKHSYNWEIAEDKLTIRPGFTPNMPVTVVSDDHFSFRWFGDVHLQRGSCK